MSENYKRAPGEEPQAARFPGSEIPPADPTAPYRIRIDRALNELSAAIDALGTIPLTDEQRTRLAELAQGR